MIASTATRRSQIILPGASPSPADTAVRAENRVEVQLDRVLATVPPLAEVLGPVGLMRLSHVSRRLRQTATGRGCIADALQIKEQDLPEAEAWARLRQAVAMVTGRLKRRGPRLDMLVPARNHYDPTEDCLHFSKNGKLLAYMHAAHRVGVLSLEPLSDQANTFDLTVLPPHASTSRHLAWSPRHPILAVASSYQLQWFVFDDTGALHQQGELWLAEQQRVRCNKPFWSPCGSLLMGFGPSLLGCRVMPDGRDVSPIRFYQSSSPTASSGLKDVRDFAFWRDAGFITRGCSGLADDLPAQRSWLRGFAGVARSARLRQSWEYPLPAGHQIHDMVTDLTRDRLYCLIKPPDGAGMYLDVYAPNVGGEGIRRLDCWQSPATSAATDLAGWTVRLNSASGRLAVRHGGHIFVLLDGRLQFTLEDEGSRYSCGELIWAPDGTYLLSTLYPRTIWSSLSASGPPHPQGLPCPLLDSDIIAADGRHAAHVSFTYECCFEDDERLREISIVALPAGTVPVSDNKFCARLGDPHVRRWHPHGTTLAYFYDTGATSLRFMSALRPTAARTVQLLPDPPADPTALYDIAWTPSGNALAVVTHPRGPFGVYQSPIACSLQLYVLDGLSAC